MPGRGQARLAEDLPTHQPVPRATHEVVRGHGSANTGTISAACATVSGSSETRVVSIGSTAGQSMTRSSHPASTTVADQPPPWRTRPPLSPIACAVTAARLFGRHRCLPSEPRRNLAANCLPETRTPPFRRCSRRCHRPSYAVLMAGRATGVPPRSSAKILLISGRPHRRFAVWKGCNPPAHPPMTDDLSTVVSSGW